MRISAAASVVSLSVLALACSRNDQASEPEPSASDAPGVEQEASWPAPTAADIRDPFTYANYQDVRVTHVDLDLAVDFETKTLTGTAELDFERLSDDVSALVLDANDLNIEMIETHADGDWVTTSYDLGADDDIMGSRLEIALPDGADKVRVTYATSPEAEGIQWLSPEQTASGEHPFLFTQFQPLLARTMVPLQDTPAVRITYDARITTPPELIAIMSARQDPTGERDGDYSFRMSQPIPSYLLALAVGDIEFQAINDHIGVYAEEYILQASAEEFEDTPKMEEAMERLYGPYLWDRYDLIVLPPSFPFGGMENPRLSFMTPTLIAGDKSLTNVVAHELAHSWSGNLVTNATWRDAWLNEGFTSYVENRTMEALYGEERAVMERHLDKASLMRDVQEAERPALTALKMPADLAHPDDAFSQVSYAGGMFFLKFLEERFGRDAFDAFLRSYFDEYAFQSITTADFLSYFEDHLWADQPQAVTKEEIDAWVFEPGFPDTIEDPQSDAFERVSAQMDTWLGGGDVSGLQTSEWTTHEWLHFINNLPEDISIDQMSALDGQFDLSTSQNAEIANAWYLKAIKASYEPAFEPLDAFLIRVGRGKFIYRLYQALVDNGRREWAQSVYERARPGYHPIAQRRIDGIMAG
ncbi:M1 family metallopeptidase [Hyphococcus flavus]|uniref:Aminopeptidase N n=1 Tax=Hyphococcus flavus TaxID=1866326 RepID=A0AAE9ZBN4_9PROT|nr:M1 family metallopeptidase [Hyphococcus flavus]WDI31156.1 M1 family metallopeptidase [Hyphococcus flavus]